MMRDWLGELIVVASILHAELVTAIDRLITELTKRSARVRSRLGGAASGFGSWLERRADDDLISASEEQAGLGARPENEADIPTLLAQATLFAPGNLGVAQARRAIETKLLARPDLKDTAWAAAKNLINKTKRRAINVDAGKA